MTSLSRDFFQFHYKIFYLTIYIRSSLSFFLQSTYLHNWKLDQNMIKICCNNLLLEQLKRICDLYCFQTLHVDNPIKIQFQFPGDLLEVNPLWMWTLIRCHIRIPTLACCVRPASFGNGFPSSRSSGIRWNCSYWRAGSLAPCLCGNWTSTVYHLYVP